MSGETDNDCECGTKLEVDIKSSGGKQYLCPACGMRYDRMAYLTAINNGKKPEGIPGSVTIVPPSYAAEHEFGLKGEDGTMGKKAECKKCKRNMNIVARGLCGKCYAIERKEPTALANSEYVERGEQPDLSHGEPSQIIPIKLKLDIEINVKVRVEKE